MMSKREIEEGTRLRLDFSKLKKVASCGEEVVPAVAQEVESGAVLIVGYANEVALRRAMETGKATFWSTSRKELWVKGETSGDTLMLEEIRVNCEQNSILYRVRLAGRGSCHTVNPNGARRFSCFYRRINPKGELEFVESPPPEDSSKKRQ